MKIFLIWLLPWTFHLDGEETWGFYAHSLINRMAIFSLPPEMIGFYKPHTQYIGDNAVNPDRRRYAVKGEAEKHFIDLDHYGDSALQILPMYWSEAIQKISEDSLRANGIGPWSAYLTFLSLTKAFEDKNPTAILRLSADLGHYLADLNVPLHTTKNYNGQLTGQNGIHGFWESRVPELMSEDYSLWIGQASYVSKPQVALWETVAQVHQQVDSVLTFEKKLTNSFSTDQKFSFEERNGLTVRVYSREFTEAYARALDNQIERQMKASIRMVANFWYTAWINAGQPNLNKIELHKGEDEKMTPNSEIKTRSHEGN